MGEAGVVIVAGAAVVDDGAIGGDVFADLDFDQSLFLYDELNFVY